MFRVRCKSCQKLLSIPDDQVGKPFRCPTCQNLIVIRPKATVPATVTTGAANTAASEPQTSFVPQADEDEAIVLGEKDAPPLHVSLPRRAKRVEAIFVNCRVCNQRMQISTSDLGKAVQCESCKAVMKVDLPTVEASLAAAASAGDDDESLASPAFDPSDIQNIPSARRSYARRRANLRGRLGEKLVVGFIALSLLGGLAWLVHHYMLQGKPLRDPPAVKGPAASKSPTAAPAATPIVDTYSWVDADNPTAWDTFLNATWGVNPSALKDLVPTEAPSELFDAGNLKWYQAAHPPAQIGSANIRTIRYAFLQQGDEQRLCEIQVQCQSSNDCEQLKEYLCKTLGAGVNSDNPFATHEWQGQTSAHRDVQVEVGGKTPTFDGTMIRAAIQGVQ